MDHARRTRSPMTSALRALLCTIASSTLLVSSVAYGGATFKVRNIPPQYPACCNLEGCLDGYSNQGRMGCNVALCGVPEGGDDCASNEVAALCDSNVVPFSDPTVCTVYINRRGQLTETPPAATAPGAPVAPSLTIMETPIGYEGCCLKESCTDADPEEGVGCDTEDCRSLDLPGDTCGSNELAANCYTFGDGTICDPAVTRSLQLTRDPGGVSPVTGCCDSCVAFPGSEPGKPDWTCQGCSSAEGPNDCNPARDWTANCSLIGGVFSCSPSSASPPATPTCRQPPYGLAIGHESRKSR